MFSNWQLTSVSIAYIGLLFVIAFFGDKYRHKLKTQSDRIIYALTLGVYCTSWSFLGTTAQAANNFLSHLPIYLGPILLFIFAWSFIKRIIRVSLKLNLTSIADLLAARFGKSHSLAVLITLVALIGTLPYIALQLKAIVYAFHLLQSDDSLPSWQFGLIVCLVLTSFTIVFGIRNISVTERHPGVMLAIAFESLVKIVAFLCVGIFITYFLFQPPDISYPSIEIGQQLVSQINFPNITSMLAMLVIATAAFLTLPRQFQVMVVELNNKNNTRTARYLFPCYLMVFAVFAIPLGLAGNYFLGNTVPADAYVLFLPWHQNQAWLTLFSFLGAISAASSMVIISSIALSTMLSNEIVFPWFIRAKKPQQQEYNSFRSNLLVIRRSLVCVVIFLSYGVFLFVSPETLSSLGEIAFGAFAQLTPALVAAFYFRRASLIAVYAGILVGFSTWLVLNFLPQLGLYHQPFNDSYIPATSLATLLALSANILIMWVLSPISRQSVQERIQAALFIENPITAKISHQRKHNIDLSELTLLVSRFVGEEAAKNSFATFERTFNNNTDDKQHYQQKLLQHTEKTLASVMGASSARLVLASVLEGRDIALDEVALLVEDASTQRQQYSQDLLHSAIENASEGISIVDSQLNLVAWNKKYLELFNYPSELIYQGSPIKDLIAHNLQQVIFSHEELERQVQKRLMFLRNGSSHRSEREYADGKVIRIEGNPLPGGGFVMLFSDITSYRAAEKGLKAANFDLESRVKERTKKLAQANEELVLARKKAEQAHIKKSLFLKACGHDLMQPLEAARLFSAALSETGNLTEIQQKQIQHIDHALKVANDLVNDLAEIARIESGNIKPNVNDFALQRLFDEIKQEFSANAKELMVDFKINCNGFWVTSDRKLLRRIIQNLVANAFRYASPGTVTLNALEDNGYVNIQVIDNGPGIPIDKQKLVFEQFTQLENTVNNSGLGLGLNITQSLSLLLGHKLSLFSQPDHGCVFTVNVAKADPQTEKSIQSKQDLIKSNQTGLAQVCVMCIDNDDNVLAGMVELLLGWQCRVIAANSYQQALELYQQYKMDIEILLVDYQLEKNKNGIELISVLRKASRHYLPAILITATTDESITDKAQTEDIAFMKKIIKPAALRALMNAMLTKKLKTKFF